MTPTDKDIASLETLDTKVQLLYQEMEHMNREMGEFKERTQKDMTEVKKKLDEKFVSQVEFKPVKQLVYGLVGLVLTAVFAGLIGLVVIQ